MKIRPVGAQLFHADRLTYMAKLIVAFWNFAKKTPKNLCDIHKVSCYYLKNVGWSALLLGWGGGWGWEAYFSNPYINLNYTKERLATVFHLHCVGVLWVCVSDLKVHISTWGIPSWYKNDMGEIRAANHNSFYNFLLYVPKLAL
jgi:hypothetical protein